MDCPLEVRSFPSADARQWIVIGAWIVLVVRAHIVGIIQW